MRHFIPILLFFLPDLYVGQITSTIAGILDSTGMKNSTMLKSHFNNPHGIDVDNQGNIYIADRFNHMIRKIDVNGNVTTLAGTGNIGQANGPGNQATFYEPWDVEADNLGNVYVADTRNNLIRKIDGSGNVSTFAGTGTFGYSDNSNPFASSFGNPSGLALDEFGNLYIADHLTHLIRKIDGNGSVSTLAGSKLNFPNNYGTDDGFGSAAKFYRPYGISIGIDGNIYVADEWNHLIRKVTPQGQVTTIAGTGTIGSVNGAALQASFNFPWDIIQDSALNLYVIDGYNFIIRKIDTLGNVSSFVGNAGTSGATDGRPNVASFNGATGLCYLPNENAMLVADTYNELIRKVALSNTKPKIDVSRNLICQYDTVAINVLPTVFDFYDYYVNGTLVKSSNNPKEVITLISSGLNSIKVIGNTALYSDTSNTRIVNVFPNIPPTINYTTLVVEPGDTILLSSSSSGKYLWSNGDTTQNILIDTIGNYWVRVTNSFGCTSQSMTVRVTVKPEIVLNNILIIGDTLLCKGDSAILVANQSNVVWYKNGNILPNFDSALIVKNTGTYFYGFYDSLSNFIFSDTVSITEKIVKGDSLNNSDTVSIWLGDSTLLYLLDTNSEVINWSNGSLNDTLVINSGGYYWVNYVYDGCLLTSDSVFIEVLNQPTLTIALFGDSTLCPGDFSFIQSNIRNIKWYRAGVFLEQDTSQILVDTTGIYYYSYEVGNTVFYSDSIYVRSITPIKPIVSIIDTNVVYQGDSVELSVSNATNFFWSNGSLNNQIVVHQTDTLWVTNIDTFGCVTYSDTIYVKVLTLPTLVLSVFGDTIFCKGDSTVLLGNTPTKKWYKNGVLIDSASIIYVSDTGQYQFSYLFNNDTILYSNTVRIQNYNTIKPILSISNDTSFYEGRTVSISSSNAVSYLWSTGDTTQTIFVDTAGFLWVNVVDSNGCNASSDSILLSLIYLPKMLVNINGDSAFCEGESTILEANVNSNLSWYKNGLPMGTNANAILVSETGWYYFVHNHNGDTVLYSDTVYIREFPLPNVNFYTYDTLINRNNSTVHFQFSGQNTGLNYNWNFGDIHAGDLENTSDEKSPSHNYTMPGVYSVSLTVIDSNGCQNSIALMHYIRFENDLFIPNAFSPNGDGNNDAFRIMGNGINKGSLLIFNQWGELIFETTDIKAGWDGTRNGLKVDYGTYTYVFQIEDNYKSKQLLRGKVTLLK